MPPEANGYPDNRKTFPKVLAFDTSGPFVAIGITADSYSGGHVEEMARGQAEVLFPLLERTLNSAGWKWGDLDAIGVGIGPGNFTGIRIAVAAARGLGLSLNVPVFGLSNFDILRGRPEGRQVISLPAPREMAYVQGFIGNAPATPARLIDPSDPPRDLQLSFGTVVLGYRAVEIASKLDAEGFNEDFAPNPELAAELTEELYLKASTWPIHPAPLYIRPADAAPPREAPPVILP